MTHRFASRRVRWPPFSILLAAIALGAAVLRWHNIGDYSLWLDEIGHVVVARRPLLETLAGVRSHAAAAPLDYLAVGLVTDVLGQGTVMARAWSFTMGVAGVVAVGLLGRRVSGRASVGLLAAAGLGLSAFHIFYSQEARFYAASATAALGLVGTFSWATSDGRPRSWIAYAVMLTVALYTHYLLGLLAIAAGVALGGQVLFSRRSSQRRAAPSGQLRQFMSLALATAAAGLAFLPWYLYAGTHQLSVSHPLLPTPLDLERGAAVVLNLFAPSSSSEAAGPLGWALVAATLALAGIGLVLSHRLRQPALAHLAITFVAFMPVVWVANQWGGYRFAERQVIALLPVTYLFAAIGADTLVMAASRRVRTAWVRNAAAIGLGGIWLLLSAAPIGAVWDGSWRTKEDWRGAAAFVSQQICRGSQVFVNLGPLYAHGIGYYRPELLTSIHHLAATQERPLPILIRDQPLGEGDWIVVLRDAPHVFAPGVGGLDAISAHLGGRGYQRRDFTERLRVFIPHRTCAS